MNITVDLQEPFTYSIIPVIVIGILIFICVVAIIAQTICKKKKKTKKPAVPIQTVWPKDIMPVRQQFIMQLNALEGQLAANAISTREAYRQMSMCIRAFVFEVTGIEVLSYSLSDIRSLKMPLLEELVEEYYAPEFAGESTGDAFASINKTKRAIEKWR